MAYAPLWSALISYRYKKNMQNYLDLAAKNGISLIGTGLCQFCGAHTTRGVHECVEIFSLGFEWINYAQAENHVYRFLSVDAHTLQHPELHGRWNNHFHLLRQHLIFTHHIHWNYQLSPKLSDHLNRYKADRQEEYLDAPDVLLRGEITTTDILKGSTSKAECQEMIEAWGTSVYATWQKYHELIDQIASGFIKQHTGHLPKWKR